ncbi:MAG: tyrosine recombinase XerC [Ruminococcus sp.]|nr:tyrosine recombinase XerC [Ruminococcus sp.]
MIDYTEIPPYLGEYITYLRVVKGRGERTIEAYYTDLRMFLRYLKKTKLGDNSEFDEIDISDVPISVIQDFTLNDAYVFLDYVSRNRSNAATTRARKVSSLKGFFKFLSVKTTYLTKDPIKNLELPSLKKGLPHFMTLEQSIDFLKSVNSNNIERDYCIITLFLNCGMRLSELVGINRQDISFTERTLRLLGKGNKERVIYINDACISAIQNYISSREQPKSEPDALFISRNGKRISKRRVQQIVEDTLKAAGLDKQGLSTHKLRHTAATLMYQHGNVDTLVLKEVLGHKSISTTEIYTHVSNKLLQNAADNSPLANVDMTKSKKQDKK